MTFFFVNRYESNDNVVITCSTKVCSFGKQVVEKVETEYSRLENSRFVYRIHRSPMCEYMINFIQKLKHLPERYMMNSVLENFTILQVRNIYVCSLCMHIRCCQTTHVWQLYNFVYYRMCTKYLLALTIVANRYYLSSMVLYTKYLLMYSDIFLFTPLVYSIYRLYQIKKHRKRYFV